MGWDGWDGRDTGGCWFCGGRGAPGRDAASVWGLRGWGREGGLCKEVAGAGCVQAEKAVGAVGNGRWGNRQRSPAGQGDG